MTELFEDLKEALGEVAEIRAGRKKPGRTYIVDVPVIDVAAIRRATGLTQADFAGIFGFALATVRAWEQGKRSPDAAARGFLKVIAANPERAAKTVRKPLSGRFVVKGMGKNVATYVHAARRGRPLKARRGRPLKTLAPKVA